MFVSTTWPQVLATGVLVVVRLSGMMLFAPPLNSPAIPARVKAALTVAIAVLVAPAVLSLPKTAHEITIAGVLGEVAVGLFFGFTLTLLNEAILFASSLMSMSFSFSLANLMDPNSRVETPVLGTLLGWVATLVLLGAGLHRAVLASIIRSFTVVPPGSAVMKASVAHGAVEMLGGVFFAGLQLAAPVLAASVAVEVVVAFIGRVAPALPAQVIGIPVKTMLSYAVLIGSLAIWPRWIEAHFTRLLDAAQTMVMA